MGIEQFMSFSDTDDDSIEPIIKSVKKEEISVHYDYGTEESLHKYFECKKKLAKDDYVVFKGKKTLTGSLIKSTDKILNVLLVNAADAVNTKFISVTFRTITEREIKKVTKEYVSLDKSQRVPILVERKYMEDLNFIKHRQKIVEQFL